MTVSLTPHTRWWSGLWDGLCQCVVVMMITSSCAREMVSATPCSTLFMLPVTLTFNTLNIFFSCRPNLLWRKVGVKFHHSSDLLADNLNWVNFFFFLQSSGTCTGSSRLIYPGGGIAQCLRIYHFSDKPLKDFFFEVHAFLGIIYNFLCWLFSV